MRLGKTRARERWCRDPLQPVTVAECALRRIHSLSTYHLLRGIRNGAYTDDVRA